jgi:GMP synthase (glutamine-hydrolysing)
MLNGSWERPGRGAQAVRCCLVSAAPATTPPAEPVEQPVLTVVQLDDTVPLDRFADHLDGVRVRLVRAHAGEEAGPARDLDGLLVLGGRMSAHDEQEPGIAATRALLADAVAAGVPTLGICLGAQLLAVATGGQVHVAAPPGREVGVVDVRWRPEAAADPLMGGLAADAEAAGTRSTPMPTMHADAVVDLPRGAAWLAASRMYPYQAFRVGERAWGVQFHPETSPETMHRWAVDAGDPEPEIAAVDAAVAAADDRMRVDGARVAATFAGLVAARVGDRAAV